MSIDEEIKKLAWAIYSEAGILNREINEHIPPDSPNIFGRIFSGSSLILIDAKKLLKKIDPDFQNDNS